MSAIYITSAINVHVITQADGQKECEPFEVHHTDWLNKSLGNYFNERVAAGTARYVFEVLDVAYYTSKIDAEYQILTNAGDINESGAYPYASLLKVEEGYLYARECSLPHDVSLYRYVPKANIYVRIDQNEADKENTPLYLYMNQAVRGIKPTQ